MAGAVDLAAVKARNEAAARAAETPAPAEGQYVVQVTEQSFQTDVLDRSFQVPVIIDVSSARSPASQQLSAALEQLAAEAQGAWLLARVDADANVRIAQALQVQAVPTVFAVLSGQLVPGFEGALPEPQLREFVTAVQQAAAEAGMAAPVAGDEDQAPADEPDDPRFLAAEAALEEGDYELAIQRYQDILDAEPANTEAALALGQVRLLQRIETHPPDVVARAESDPDDVEAQLAAADLELAGNEVDKAFSRVLGLLTRTTAEEREAARQRLLEYFELLGSDDPRVAPARREMARVLF
jgi:putative thioredoxin